MKKEKGLDKFEREIQYQFIIENTKKIKKKFKHLNYSYNKLVIHCSSLLNHQWKPKKKNEHS